MSDTETEPPAVEPPTADPATRAIPTVAMTNLKIPPFWPTDPQLWFAQIEAQFTTRHITQQRTKFDHVVSSLAPEVATEVRDLILSPPASTPYDQLKQQLIKRTAATEQQRLQQLLNLEELGDRKPTQLLRRMEQLLGDKKPDQTFLRELFLQRLPSNVRMVLASTGESTKLQDLAQLADNIMEVATSPSVAAVRAPAPQLAEELDRLRPEVSALKDTVQSLSRTSRPFDRRRSQFRGRSPSPSVPSDTTTLCWYHTTFGDNAKRCAQPCSYNSENRKASR